MALDDVLLFVNGTLELHGNLAAAELLEETATTPRCRLHSIGDVHPGMYEVGEDEEGRVDLRRALPGCPRTCCSRWSRTSRPACTGVRCSWPTAGWLPGSSTAGNWPSSTRTSRSTATGASTAPPWPPRRTEHGRPRHRASSGWRRVTGCASRASTRSGGAAWRSPGNAGPPRLAGARQARVATPDEGQSPSTFLVWSIRSVWQTPLARSLRPPASLRSSTRPLHEICFA